VLRGGFYFAMWGQHYWSVTGLHQFLTADEQRNVTSAITRWQTNTAPTMHPPISVIRYH
jgi:hypothetical protein